MRLVAVDKLPVGRRNHKLQKLLEEFAHSNAKVCKIDLEEQEYKSINVAYSVIGIAAKRSKRPIKIRRRNNELYLVKEI